MISAEAPVLFAKAAQIFITELTLRAWIHTEDNKRRTLQVRYKHRLVTSSFHSVTSSFTRSSVSDHSSAAQTNWCVKFKALSSLCTFVFMSVYYNNYMTYLWYVTLALSFFLTCPYYTTLFFSTLPTPHTLIRVPFWFVAFISTKCLWLCVHTIRGPIPASPLRNLPLLTSFSHHWLWKRSQAGAGDPLFPLVPFCLLCCPKVE